MLRVFVQFQSFDSPALLLYLETLSEVCLREYIMKKRCNHTPEPEYAREIPVCYIVLILICSPPSPLLWHLIPNLRP